MYFDGNKFSALGGRKKSQFFVLQNIFEEHSVLSINDLVELSSSFTICNQDN